MTKIHELFNTVDKMKKIDKEIDKDTEYLVTIDVIYRGDVFCGEKSKFFMSMSFDSLPAVGRAPIAPALYRLIMDSTKSNIIGDDYKVSMYIGRTLLNPKEGQSSFSKIMLGY